MIKLQAIPVTLDAAAGEDSPRTITGLAVPWSPVSAVVSDGTKVSFLRGAFDLEAKNPKLLENHDSSQLRGVVTELADSEEGLLFTAKFAKTRASDDAIELVKAGAYDSVSVGAIPEKFTMSKDGTMIVSQATLAEISLVASPAFKDAIITEIAASEPDQEVEEEATETPNNDTSEEETMSQENPVEASQPDVIPTQPIFATARRETPLPTAAEYISALLVGGDQWRAMSASLKAAAPNIVTDDNPGTLPISVVAPVYNNFIGRRPVVDAIGVRAMPQGGKVFIRPEVTTHTSIGASISEQSPTGGTLVVFNNQVTKQLFGGYVNISEFDIDVSQPEILSVVLDDMARIYANATDNYAADQLASGATTTSNFTAASVDDPSYWAEWVANAAETILSASNGNLPTHMFMNPSMWAELLKLSDTADRPLFPQIGPMNAFGSLAPGQVNGNAFGLQVVVDRNFNSATTIIGDATGYELFEMQKGAISIDSPSTLSRTVAFRGQFAALMIDSSKFVKAAFV
jgi:HK97 family phage prohead protease